MEKLSGLVLDVYDDTEGAILRDIFPSNTDLSELEKQAHALTPEQHSALPDEAYALVLVNNGQVMKKFATIDSGNTALSVMYFLKTAHKLPVEAQKVAAQNLVAACGWYGLEAPELLKEAGLSTLDRGKGGQQKVAAEKTAFLGIGIDVGSFAESDTAKGVINVGFPHLVSVGGRHKPTGLGLGVGLAGPVISWSPSTMEGYTEEQERIKKEKAEKAEKTASAYLRKVALDIQKMRKNLDDAPDRPQKFPTHGEGYKKAAEDKTDAELKEIGRQRGVTSLAAEAARDKGRRGERAGETVGRIGGTVGGAAAGKKYLGGRLGTMTGAGLGYLSGGKAGKELGNEYDSQKNAGVLKSLKKGVDVLKGGPGGRARDRADLYEEDAKRILELGFDYGRPDSKSTFEGARLAQKSALRHFKAGDRAQDIARKADSTTRNARLGVGAGVLGLGGIGAALASKKKPDDDSPAETSGISKEAMDPQGATSTPKNYQTGAGAVGGAGLGTVGLASGLKHTKGLPGRQRALITAGSTAMSAALGTLGGRSVGKSMEASAAKTAKTAGMLKEALGIMGAAMGALTLPEHISAAKNNLAATKGSQGMVMTPGQVQQRKAQMGML